MTAAPPTLGRPRERPRIACLLFFCSFHRRAYAAVWKKTVRERVSPTTTVASRKWLLATNCAGSYTYQQLN
jgi:hypothetical protein